MVLVAPVDLDSLFRLMGQGHKHQGTSILLLPELGIGVEDEARAALLPLELDLLLEEPLPHPLLLRHVLVQRLVPLPLLTPVIVTVLVLRGQPGMGLRALHSPLPTAHTCHCPAGTAQRELGDTGTAPSPLPDPSQRHPLQQLCWQSPAHGAQAPTRGMSSSLTNTSARVSSRNPTVHPPHRPHTDAHLRSRCVRPGVSTSEELIPLQLIPEEIAWAPRKWLPGTGTELPAQFWAQPGNSQEQPKNSCRARKQPGRSSWRSLFSLEKKRLNKKLEKGGNKALLVPHVARRN